LLRHERGILLDGHTVFSVIPDNREGIPTDHLVFVWTRRELLLDVLDLWLLLIVVQRPIVRVSRVIGVDVRIGLLRVLVKLLEERGPGSVVVEEV
jgi:hypothetical protein